MFPDRNTSIINEIFIPNFRFLYVVWLTTTSNLFICLMFGVADKKMSSKPKWNYFFDEFSYEMNESAPKSDRFDILHWLLIINIYQFFELIYDTLLSLSQPLIRKNSEKSLSNIRSCLAFGFCWVIHSFNGAPNTI